MRSENLQFPGGKSEYRAAVTHANKSLNTIAVE